MSLQLQACREIINLLLLGHSILELIASFENPNWCEEMGYSDPELIREIHFHLRASHAKKVRAENLKKEIIKEFVEFARDCGEDVFYIFDHSDEAIERFFKETKYNEGEDDINI